MGGDVHGEIASELRYRISPGARLEGDHDAELAPHVDVAPGNPLAGRHARDALDVTAVLHEPRRQEREREIPVPVDASLIGATVNATGSLLMRAAKVGGDTLFASMYHSYEALSDGMKRALEGLRAVHSSRHVFGTERYSKDTDVGDRLGNSELATQDSVHPVIIRHPETGRKALYVNRTFTLRFDGWTAEESAPLLEFLYAHASRPEFTCRFRWREHSMAFWDNRAVWHMALNDYHGHRRLMHRITIEGVPLG